MILKEIRIRNFRPFRDISIDFAHGDKNITIIKGNRGTGRTAIINAISWCLYGYEIRNDYDLHSPICNTKAVHLANYGDEIEVSVELIFDDDGELLSFRRFQGFRKVFEKLINSSDHLEVREQIENDILISHEDQFAIEKRIPRKIMNLFLLDNYNIIFNQYDKKQILEPFFNLSQLNILENVIRHLSMVKHYYISKLKKLDADISNNYENKKILEDKLHKAESKKRECLKSKDHIHSRINSIKKELESIDIDISKLLQRKIDLQDSINNNISDLEKLEEQLNKHVLTNYPYVLFYDLLNSIDLGEKSLDATLNINEFKEDITKDVREFKDMSLDFHKKIREIQYEKENNINELHKIEYLLSSVDQLEVEFLLEEYNLLIEHKHEFDWKIIHFSHEIEYLKDSLKAESKKEILLVENNNKLDEYNKKIEFCEESIRVVEGIFTQFNEELIRNLEVGINDNFSKIYPKDQLFELFFNENYEFILKNRNGVLLNFNDLSTDEQSLLELIFVATLKKIFGVNLPIIIDFPSWFDRDTKIHMANYLIDLSHENQIISLIAAENEFAEIISRHSKIYELNYEMTEDGPESKVVLDD